MKLAWAIIFYSFFSVFLDEVESLSQIPNITWTTPQQSMKLAWAIIFYSFFSVLWNEVESLSQNPNITWTTPQQSMELAWAFIFYSFFSCSLRWSGKQHPDRVPYFFVQAVSTFDILSGVNDCFSMTVLKLTAFWLVALSSLPTWHSLPYVLATFASFIGRI
jgi:hypothetical protein